MKDSTLVTHPPQVTVPADNRPLIAPIYQTVKFTFDSIDEIERQQRGDRDGFWYSRRSNPTLRQLELTLAKLQGREACLLTASGVAATNLPMLALCKQGDHVVCFAEMYGPTRHMVRKIMARFGIRHTLLSIEDMEGLERVLAGTPTRLIVFESPTNPVLKIADLSRIADLAKRHGALTLLDNTLAGFHNHAQFPIDLYAHSLTKYASGHGDVLGGALIGNCSLIEPMRGEVGILGATLDAHAAFLIQRGMRTYFLRYERQCATAQSVAEFLRDQPQVRRVSYPGLTSHPQHELARKQQADFGTIVTFDLNDASKANEFAERLKFFTIASSLGSTESLILPPALLKPRDLMEPARGWSGISEHTVRLSIGIEDAGDLIGDLEAALQAS